MRRRNILVALGVLALIPIMAVVAVLLIPAERVGAFAAGRASAMVGRAVDVERFGIGLFPPAIELEGVRVAGVTDADSALATAARAELRPRLLPLLRRRVIIDEIALEQPVFRIEVYADSTTNIPVLASADSGAGGGDAELDIRRLRVNDGRIVYRNAIDNTVVSIGDLDQTLSLSGAMEQGELASMKAAGKIAVADLDVAAPTKLAFPIDDFAFALEHDVAIDRSTDRIDIESLTLTIREIVLDVAGNVSAFSDSLARTVDLHARTGDIDIANLIASLPQSVLGTGADMLTGAGGTAQLDVRANGRAGAGEVPDVSGTLALSDGAVARRAGTIASALTGRIAFSLDSISTDGFNGRLLGEPFTLTFSIRDFAAPQGQVVVQGALALDEARRTGLIPDSVQAGGNVRFDVTVAGTFTDPTTLAVTGAVDLAGVQVATAALQKPLRVESGRVQLEGQSATTTDLRAKIGESDVALDANADGWLPFALGDTLHRPAIKFDVRSAVLDMDEILGPKPETYTYGQLFVARLADRQLDGRNPADIAEEMGLGLPQLPEMSLDGRIRAQRFVRGSLPLNDVDITVGSTDGQLDIRAASFRMMGGGVHLAGRLGLAADSAVQPLALDYTVSDVAAATFLQRFTGFKEHITGDMLVAGTMTMLLDRQLLPVRESVAGAGTLAVLEGEIVNWPMLHRLGDRIGIADFDTLAFKDWSGRYRIDGPRVVLEESALESGDIGLRAAGTFDVNGTLDLGATLYLPQEWAARVPGAPAGFVASAAAGEDGRVPVGARFTGTARDPSVALDMSEAGARVASAAREAAQREAQEAAARAAEQLIGRLPGSDSTTTAADSLKKKVESEVTNRLRRIIRH